MVTQMPMSKSTWASHTSPVPVRGLIATTIETARLGATMEAGPGGKQRPTPSGAGHDHGERNRWQNSKMI
jgi:hypothetical protein